MGAVALIEEMSVPPSPNFVSLSFTSFINLVFQTRVFQQTLMNLPTSLSQGPDECDNSSAHTVKEQHAPEVHREVALLNTDNETSIFQAYRILL